MLSNKDRILYNTSSSLILQILTVVSGFILPNLYLRFYGAENYGLVVSLTQYLSLISLCDLGVSAVVQSAIYKPYYNNNRDALSSIYVASQHFFKNIAYVLILYVIVLMLIFPHITDSKVDVLYSSTMIIVLSVKLFLQYYFGITNKIFLNSAQFIYITNTVSSVSLIVNLVISIILIQLKTDLLTVLLMSSIVFVVQPVAFNYYVNKKFDIKKRSVYDHNVIPQKWNGMAQHFATIVLENSPTIILTILCPLTSVAIYALYHMVTNGLKMAFISVFQSFLPFLGSVVVNNDKLRLLGFFNAFSWLLISSGMLVFTVTAITIIPFLQIYTSQMDDSAMYINNLFGVLMSIASCLYLIRLPFNYLIQAFGHFKQTQLSAVIEVIINVIITVVCIKIWGIIGTAIGMCIALAYRICYFVFYSKKLTDYKISFFLRIIIVNVFSSIIIYSISRLVTYNTTTYIQWSCAALILTTFSIIISILCNLPFFYKQIKLVFGGFLRR